MDYMVYFVFLGCVLLPLLLMLVIYVHIFLAARRQLLQTDSKVAPAPSPPPSGSSSFSSRCSQSRLRKEVHAAKSVAILVGVFALCWLPVHIINCFNYLCQRCERTQLWVINAAIVLSHANSVVNPVIYAYRIRQFRLTFRRILFQYILCWRGGAPYGPRINRDLVVVVVDKEVEHSVTRSPSGTSQEGSLCSTVVSSCAPDSDRVPESCSTWTPADDAATSQQVPPRPDPSRSDPRSDPPRPDPNSPPHLACGLNGGKGGVSGGVGGVREGEGGLREGEGEGGFSGSV